MNISIVMATYNGAKYLKEQLDSIAAQTKMPMELVICDDASTDETVNIIKAHALAPIIKLVINPVNQGVVASFKKAASLCHSNNYIAFCDQDDIWHTNKLEENLNAILNFPTDKFPVLVYSDAVFIDASKNTINQSFMNEMGMDKYQHTYQTVLFGSLMLGCSIMINPTMRNYLLEMPEQIIFNHDAWMSLIAFSFGACNLIDKPLLDYRKHEKNSTIANFEKKSRLNRITVQLKAVFIDKQYLQYEIELAKNILQQFETEFSQVKIRQIKKFIELEHKPYFIKKLYFELVFFKYWKNRF